MKRLFLLMTFFALIFSISSCKKKERTCRCKDNNTGVYVDTDMDAARLKKQKEACEGRSVGSVKCNMYLL